MSKLPIAGILVLMLLVVSGYVASEPAEATDEVRAGDAVVSIDPHINYYREHLQALKLSRPER